jgi:uncharacterized SAM-binding protein YcdF (DUF218 family)
MFLFKKIVAPFLFPLPLCLGTLIVGLILLWFTRRKKAGKVLVTIGVALLAILSYGFFSTSLLRQLEYRHPPLQKMKGFRDVNWVVVLSGGATSDPKVPITSQLSSASLVRLVEGIRLHRMLPNSNLLLSGGRTFDPVPKAKIMAEVALALGVNRDDIVLETISKDTKDEALLIKEMVGNERFVLVTSASHMPRSMALFEKLGMKPIPAPTGHSVKERQQISPGMFFPSSGGLRRAEKAFYEYLGLAWAKLRGQI